MTFFRLFWNDINSVISLYVFTVKSFSVKAVTAKYINSDT